MRPKNSVEEVTKMSKGAHYEKPKIIILGSLKDLTFSQPDWQCSADTHSHQGGEGHGGHGNENGKGHCK